VAELGTVWSGLLGVLALDRLVLGLTSIGATRALVPRVTWNSA
jgi:hypothetical protein